MSAQTQPWITPAEYLELERAAEFRHEYYNGRMFAMSGGTPKHSRIGANLIGELHAALKNTECGVFTSDMRVRVAPDGLYTYPDVLVVCGEPELSDDHNDTLINPTLIIEVLSPSNEAYDRGFKSTQYRKLPTLQEYALVSQTEPRIELFRRQPTGGWFFSEVSGLDGACHFASVNCSIALADVYKKVTLSSDPLADRPSQAS